MWRYRKIYTSPKSLSYHQRQHPLLHRVTGLSFLLGIITNSVIIG
jgi:hypothetical protein